MRRESEEGDCASVCTPKLQVDEDIKGSSWQSRVCKWLNFCPPGIKEKESCSNMQIQSNLERRSRKTLNHHKHTYWFMDFPTFVFIPINVQRMAASALN